ncbi:MAG: hypothetical protein EA391_14585 [Balneolaceae bacterium]|nr:MAG: hypothetical protein EA391_14585 [Balneolaceae bacterium]
MKNSEFIPAKESKWFIALFDRYVRLLFWRRFKNVWVQQGYQPANDSKSIYYINHSSWWDGLIPLLLNQKIFHQNARAMMEDKQLRQHSFFKKIGAFSVNLENPRAVIKSLRYAVDSFERPNSSLYIFPEGKIVPFSTKRPCFKKGLAWIAQKSPDLDVVPIGVYIHTAGSDKPELFLKIGKKVTFKSSDNPEELNLYFEHKLGELLEELVRDAHSNSETFSRLI